MSSNSRSRRPRKGTIIINGNRGWAGVEVDVEAGTNRGGRSCSKIEFALNCIYYYLHFHVPLKGGKELRKRFTYEIRAPTTAASASTTTVDAPGTGKKWRRGLY